MLLLTGTDPARPTVEARFMATSFANGPALIPLLRGPVAVIAQDPADAVLVMSDSQLCLRVDQAGNHPIRLTLLAAQNPLEITLPACPAAMIRSQADDGETSTLLTAAQQSDTPIGREPLALCATGSSIRLRWLEPQESSALAKSTKQPVQGTPARIDDATIRQANWSLHVEPEGSMLTQGVLEVDHSQTLDLLIEPAEGMRLLRCMIADQTTAPADLGHGRLLLQLPAASAGPSRVTLAFTSSGPAIDPLEGTLAVALPKLPLFIQSLQWNIELPDGYQAETHGNLVRLATPGARPNSLTLRKNLLRDECPETRVFYQRASLNR